jgi:hypothetical protein
MGVWGHPGTSNIGGKESLTPALAEASARGKTQGG